MQNQQEHKMENRTQPKIRVELWLDEQQKIDEQHKKDELQPIGRTSKSNTEH